MPSIIKIRSALISAACCAALSVFAVADVPAPLNVPAGELIEALKALAKQADLELVYQPEQMKGLRTEGVQGIYSAHDAVKLLLKGTSLQVHTDTSGAMVIAPAEALPAASNVNPAEENILRVAQAEPAAASTDSGEAVKLEEVVVTGTNIKGTAPAGSPVLVLDEQAIRRSGYTSTEQLIQSLPQNIRSGAEGATPDPSGFISGSQAGFNSTRGSGANLRGLGATATLTLINGRRIAASAFGTFTDISLIPINAIDRIEVLTDGASAIYGADAVAGVINIILKKTMTALKRGCDTAPPRRADATKCVLLNYWEASGPVGAGW